MADLISREAVIALINASIFDLEYADENIAMQEAIKLLPTIEAEPVKHGTWWHYEGTLTCSVCHTEIYDDIMDLLGDDVPRYCPDCGAKMDEVKE